MARLSVVLIVRDEAAQLRACLETASWADEIVVLDGGSRDDTVAIARTFTDHVHVNADWQGFGVQRQRAQSMASGDWILMLDADERITPELRGAIAQVVRDDDRNIAGAVARLPVCFGRIIRHGGWYADRVVRLYPRERAGYDDTRVHEGVRLPAGMRVANLPGDLVHYTYRDLEHYLTKSASYAAIWADDRARRGRKAGLADAVGHALAKFLKMYVLRGGFRDGRIGLLLAVLASHSVFVKYADLWLRWLPVPADGGPSRQADAAPSRHPPQAGDAGAGR
ncbi:MAG TPA: glycosyltransferase family 2 protein [Longimicrobiales bacterium]|nr:glycosyltransferase family 2 protein [Longimicrobiales bacterium]